MSIQVCPLCKNPPVCDIKGLRCFLSSNFDRLYRCFLSTDQWFVRRDEGEGQMVGETQMWQKAGFVGIGDVAVNLVQSVLLSCGKVHIFVEFWQDRVQVGLVKISSHYNYTVCLRR